MKLRASKCKNHPEKVANFSPLSTRSDQVTMTDPDQKDGRMERGEFFGGQLCINEDFCEKVRLKKLCLKDFLSMENSIFQRDE